MSAGVEHISAATVTIPVQLQERIEIIDVLRGFALLGILIVNMRDFDFPTEYFNPLQYWTSTIDRCTEWFIALFVSEKFYSLFSFLFGLGFAVQMIRLEERGKNFAPLYGRRLIALLLFGVLHGVLLWWGDILAVYALMGFVLLSLRSLTSKTILTLSVCIILLPIAYSTARLSVEHMSGKYNPNIVESPPLGNEEQIKFEEIRNLYATGTFVDIVNHRIPTLLETYTAWLSRNFGTQIFGMFLHGLFVGKMEVFQKLHAYRNHLHTVWRWSAAVSLLYIITFLFIKNNEMHMPFAVQLANFEIGKVMRSMMVLFYTTSLIMLFQKEKWKRIVSVLAFPGRMALTNYIMQSVICTFICYSYGLGWYGSISPFHGLLLTVTIFGIQIAYSVMWLKYFRFGPLEWLWRSLTYGSLQPMKIHRI